MKLKIILAFLILMIFDSCQKESFATINLKVEFQDTAKKELPRLYEILVYKDKKLFKKYSRFEKPRIEKEIVIDSLSNGTYKFVYRNFLNQRMEKSVEISQDKKHTIVIHPDYSKYTDFIKESFVNNLKDNQKVELNFESLGCFNANGYAITVMKNSGEYYIETRGIVKKLTKKEIDAIIKMECELNLLREGACTTLDHYTIKFENQLKEYDDVTCAWYGWMNMWKEFDLKGFGELKTSEIK
jgi:hypothetical protein